MLTACTSGAKTDHTAIVLDLTNKDNQNRGPGIMKMNCSLLEDENYVNDDYSIKRAQERNEKEVPPNGIFQGE